MPEVDAVLRQRTRQRGEQLGAMEMVVGRAELYFDRLAELRALQGAAVVPAALMESRRTHAAPCQSWAEAQQVQQAGGVRADLDAGADLRQDRRLLEHLHVAAGLQPRQRRRAAAGA